MFFFSTDCQQWKRWKWQRLRKWQTRRVLCITRGYFSGSRGRHDLDLEVMEVRGDRQKELHRALSDSDHGMIAEVLSSGDVNINHREPGCGLQTVLMRVCHVPMDCNERRTLISDIVAQQADVNLTDATGRTAIAHACIAEKNDVIEILAALPDCDPNIADNDGNTPLLYAVKSRKPDVVHKLLTSFPKNSIQTDHRNNRGKLLPSL